jgi:hypothetical protein
MSERAKLEGGGGGGAESAAAGNGGPRSPPARSYRPPSGKPASDWTPEEVALWWEAYRQEMDGAVDALAASPRADSICDLVIKYNAGAVAEPELSVFLGHLVECPACAGAIHLDRLVEEHLRS